MNWMRTTSFIVVITDRKTQEPVRTFLRLVAHLGYEAHVLPRISYDLTSRMRPPQVVMVDVESQCFRGATNIATGIRATWEYVPMVLLGRAEEVARVLFSTDYHGFLTLPITSQELEARIRFAQWKTQTAPPAHDVLEIANLRMNLATYEVWVENELLELTFKEFELLKFFITHQRRVFSRAELLESVWENDFYGETRTVDVHIRRLRAKLGDTIGQMIHTVRNVGYRFG